MITYLAIGVATVCLAPLCWRYLIWRQYPLEGAAKLAFVVWTLGTGGALVGLSFSVVYSVPCLAIGLGLLAAGALKGAGPVALWLMRG